MRGEPGIRRTWAQHLLWCVPVIAWLKLVCGMPLWVYFLTMVVPAYNEEDRQYFFGRDAEIEEFVRLVRRNVLIMLMCIELMLNAANLTFVTFARMLNDIGGQAIVFFVLVVAAAEVVVGLGIVVTNFRRRETTVADDLDSLKG